MDLSSLVGTLMSSDSIKNLGKATNTKESTVKNVLSAALPSLLNGAKAQSEDSTTGFADAIASHGKKDTSDLASFLGSVDLEDGGKIIGHLFGNDSSAQVSGIAKEAKTTTKATSGILSAVAPLLMSLLGQQSSSSSSSESSGIASLFGDMDLSGLLGGLLGGGSSETTTENKKKKKKPASSSSSAKQDDSILGKLGGLLGGLFKK